MEIARRLGAAFRENRLPHAMKMLTQPRLLIVDEVGYLGFDQAGAQALPSHLQPLQIQRGHTIFTSNKPFAECVGNAYKWIKENGFVDILFVENGLRRSSL